MAVILWVLGGIAKKRKKKRRNFTLDLIIQNSGRGERAEGDRCEVHENSLKTRSKRRRIST